MLTPYYSDDHVTIYHGDCLELLGEVEADVLVTDPPYGMAYSSGWARKLIWTDIYTSRSDGSIASDDTTAARDAVVEAWGDRPAIMFGRYGIDPPAGVRMALVWDKGMSAGMGDLSIPWRPNWELIFVMGDGFTGRRDSGVIHGHPNIPRVSMGRCHPHMKPVELLRDLIAKCPDGTVLDPFMGSGTTLRAAKDLGRKAIGIEIEERYCETAAMRCAQEVLLFDAP